MILRRNDDLDVKSIRNFYYRRVKRIFPPYYLVIICSLTALFLLFPLSYRSTNLDSSRGAITITSNIKRVMDDNQKYEKMLEKAEDLFVHMWSLCLEMQWYLLAPVVFLVQRCAGAFEKTFFAAIAFCSIIFYISTEREDAFYSVFARIWQFCCGILAFLWQTEMNVVEMRRERTGSLTSESGAYEKKGLDHPWEAKLPLIAACVFSSAIAVPFLRIPVPGDFFRVYVTGFSAILIVIGNYHRTKLLCNPAIVYIGDISYSLYLFHWPVYIVTRYYSPHPLALFLGIAISFGLASISYLFFERNYSKWPPNVILALIGSLVVVSAVLALQPNSIYENEFGSAPVDYTSMNINDATWNLTMMRYLNYMETRPRINIENSGCTYSDRFVGEDIKPLGFCSMEDGPGNHDFLVLGNSFACNQGDVIYNAFKRHARKFNIFCLSACEIMTESSADICERRINYTAMVEELKPDVVFLISRSINAKEMFDTTRPYDDDKIFKDHMEMMNKIEGLTKKVYILQALPSCFLSCALIAQEFTRKGKALYEIKRGMIAQDAFFARERIAEVGKRCQKCEVIDYMPFLVSKNGHYFGYNERNNLLYLDNSNHLTRFAKERIQILYNRLADKFSITNQTETL
ncbi:hypothetical protein Aduo_016934 [Ancylostoma duodenale]